jgi:hypothetical protein
VKCPTGLQGTDTKTAGLLQRQPSTEMSVHLGGVRAWCECSAEMRISSSLAVQATYRWPACVVYGFEGMVTFRRGRSSCVRASLFTRFEPGVNRVGPPFQLPSVQLGWCERSMEVLSRQMKRQMPRLLHSAEKTGDQVGPRRIRARAG